jgi:hypothetical protein
MIRLVNREPLDTSSYPAKAGYLVRRGLSVQSSTSLEYWVARSSRAMTAEILISNSRNDRHCEERSDEAIHSFFAPRYGLLRSARNDVDRGNDADTVSHSRGAMRPRFARKSCPQKRGRREYRALVAPAASHAK